MPRIEPTARIAKGGATRAAASISIAPAPNISASRSEICSLHSPDAHSDQLRPSEDLFLLSYIAILRSVALGWSTPGPAKSAGCDARVECPTTLSRRVRMRTQLAVSVARGGAHVPVAIAADFASHMRHIEKWAAALSRAARVRSFPGMKRCLLRIARPMAVVAGLSAGGLSAGGLSAGGLSICGAGTGARTGAAR